MPEVELRAVRAALDEVRSDIHAQNDLMAAWIAKLDAVEGTLPTFVEKRRFWSAVWLLVFFVALATTAWLFLRAQDHREEATRRAALASAQEQDRLASIRGCERNNDLRATLREVINLALSNSTMPPGLSPELQAIYRDAQARTLAKRDELLALPGVQPVDCQAQFPPLALTATRV